jgi:dihydroorotate dehydrogenase
VYPLLRPLLFLLSAETAHKIAFALLRFVAALPFVSRWMGRAFRPTDPRLRVTTLGKTFQSPIGLAAGFDKNAEGYNALSDLGFGFVEVGTVTAEGQPGNPRPRLFRLPRDRAIINRMGFNNDGAKEVAPRLIRPRRTVVGVNIGKTKRVDEAHAIADYQSSARALAPHADYLVVNVSSPNTPGLRDLQATERLRPLLVAVKTVLTQTCTDAPLLVKIAPDMTDAQVDEIADLALELGIDGIIATNTTIGREGLRTSAALVETAGNGGLSGAPLKERALEVLERLKARVGDRLVLISVGGIETADDVWQRLRAGAALVQIYTSFIYEGPTLLLRLHAELLERMEREGIANLADLSSRAGQSQTQLRGDRRTPMDRSHAVSGSA